MSKLKKVLLITAGLAALALGGSALAGATGGGDDNDVQLSGAPADKASAAALRAAGGGKVVSVEKSDESGSAYEVKVVSGSRATEVQLDDAYRVTSSQPDDDGPGDRGDGDGETND